MAKKTAFKTWRRTGLDNDHDQYRSLKSAANRAVARAKVKHYDEFYDQILTPELTNNYNKVVLQFGNGERYPLTSPACNLAYNSPKPVSLCLLLDGLNLLN